jgi:DNA-directed RNA polymerase III subunit RPC8
MFVLSSLEDNVPVAPRDLARPLLDAVADALRQRYLDRVVPGLGLAVALYALDAVVGGGGRLYPATGTGAGGGAGGGGMGGGGGIGGPGGGGGDAMAGSAYYRARFRMAFFRPFAGEVLVGTLVEATRWGGLRVAIGGLSEAGGGAGATGAGATADGAAAAPALPSSLSAAGADAVFRDVLVRPTDMPPKSSWDPKERTWVWAYEDGTPFVMDVGGRVRVRVTSVRYPAPPTPAERRQAQQQQQMQQMQQQQQQQHQMQAAGGGGGGGHVGADPADAEAPPPVGSAANPYAPMEVLASANGDGLGMVDWWTGEEEEEEVEGGEGATAAAAAAAAEEGGGRELAGAPMEEEQ